MVTRFDQQTRAWLYLDWQRMLTRCCSRTHSALFDSRWIPTQKRHVGLLQSHKCSQALMGYVQFTGCCCWGKRCASVARWLLLLLHTIIAPAVPAIPCQLIEVVPMLQLLLLECFWDH
jgi:hypothetical protein